MNNKEMDDRFYLDNEEKLNRENIDKECRKMVILFNKMGILTEFCCQGHNDNQEFFIAFKDIVDKKMITAFKEILKENNVKLNGSIDRINRGIAGYEYHLLKENHLETIKAVNEDYIALKQLYEEKDVYINLLNNLLTKSRFEIEDKCGGLLNELITTSCYALCEGNDKLDYYNLENHCNGTRLIEFINIDEKDRAKTYLETFKREYVVFPESTEYGIRNSVDDTKEIYFKIGVETLSFLKYATGNLGYASNIKIDNDTGEIIRKQDFSHFNKLFEMYFCVSIESFKENYCEDCFNKMLGMFIKQCREFYDALDTYCIISTAQGLGEKHDGIKIKVTFKTMTKEVQFTPVCRITLLPTKLENKITCDNSYVYGDNEEHPCLNCSKFVFERDCHSDCINCNYQDECEKENAIREIEVLSNLQLIKTYHIKNHELIGEDNSVYDSAGSINDIPDVCNIYFYYYSNIADFIATDEEDAKHMVICSTMSPMQIESILNDLEDGAYNFYQNELFDGYQILKILDSKEMSEREELKNRLILKEAEEVIKERFKYDGFNFNFVLSSCTEPFCIGCLNKVLTRENSNELIKIVEILRNLDKEKFKLN